ncbi:MAG: AAA family ATPase [Candidatus Sericytochromatia bacterium]|nr:AAA family ATPase [Candidatus Sericytochromatia bacterium]
MLFEAQLDLHVRARYPLLLLATSEEQRALAHIQRVAQAGPHPREVLVWDIAEGFRPGHTAKGDPLAALAQVRESPAARRWVFVLLDFHRYWEQPQVARTLRNLAETLRAERKTIVFISPGARVPAELQEDLTVLDFPLPDRAEIAREIDQLVPAAHHQLTAPARETLIQACRGLGLQRIRQVLAKAIAADGRLDERDIDLVLEEKKQIIRQTEVLEFFPAHESVADIGGLNNLKAWLNLRADTFNEAARRYGLPNPRGLLLVGIQGTGKSLCAKAIAQLWRLPLLRLDVGRLMGNLVGESEARAREMIRLAEAMAPAVLWMDEIDKAFAGAGHGDAGTSARVLGTLITWMQEKTAPVFVVATANQVDQLPPELLRKGRFDEIFFIGLPSDDERREIFDVHLRRVRPHARRQFDLERLVAVSGGFSGAEIAQAITEAMFGAYAQQREFETNDIVTVLRESVPLSRTAQEQIDTLKHWANSGRARLASQEMPRVRKLKPHASDTEDE